jgi:hypothetical protein
MVLDLVKSDEQKTHLGRLANIALILCDKSHLGSEVALGASVPAQAGRSA